MLINLDLQSNKTGYANTLIRIPQAFFDSSRFLYGTRGFSGDPIQNSNWVSNENLRVFDENLGLSDKYLEEKAGSLLKSLVSDEKFGVII